MTDQELIDRLEQDDWKTIPVSTFADSRDWIRLARDIKARTLKGSRLPRWCINARIQVLLVDSKVVTDEKFVQLLTGDNFWQGKK